LYGNFSTSSGGRAFVMAGTPVSGAGLMSVGTTARSYKLFADPAIGGNVPFVPQMRDGTSFANPSVQDMYLLTPAASGQSGRGMQVSFGLEGQGATQRSLLVSSQLNVFTDSNGAEVLGGGMRGGMRVVATNTPDRVTSGIGTQADAANNNFFGTLDAGAPSHMVLTNTSFGTPTSAVEREAADAFRTTAAVSDQHYRFNSVAQLSSANVSRTALSGVTVLSLYTAALRENPSFQAQMISSASDFSQNAIRLDPGSNNVSAILTAPNTSGSETFRFAFGTRPSTMTGTTIVGDEADFGASGSTLATNGARGALFDRDRWNALETTADPTASGVLTTSGGVTTNNTLAGVITSTVVSPNLTNRAAAWQAYILPSTATGFNFSAWSSSVTFCQCGPDLQWGFWGGRLNFPTGYSRQDRYHLALWVGGTPATIGSIPGSGTATYTGNTVAVINDNGARYLAASNYTQTWNFGSDSGTATIANLDGRTYTAASLSAANRRDFSGALTGQASGTNGSTVNATGIGGNLRGSFFAGTTGTADNVRFAAGNFNVASGTYSATGIFLSKR
jgi:hypothetical protein